MRLAVLGLVCVLGLTACGSQPAASGGVSDVGADRELALARSVAEDEAVAEEAALSSATYVVRDGTVTDSNVGHPCTSGSLIEVKLIGHFPHIVTTGHAVEAGQDEDFTVTAMIVTADGADGSVCLKGVQTGDVEPEPGAVDIPLG